MDGRRDWWSFGGLKELDVLRSIYNKNIISGTTDKVLYPNGNVEIEQTFKNKKLNGVRKIYLPSGELTITEEFKDGRRVGHRKSFFLSGQLSNDVEYDNDLIKKAIRYQYLNNGKQQRLSTHEIELIIYPEKYPEEIKKRTDSLRAVPTTIASFTEYDADGRSNKTKFYLPNKTLQRESYLDWSKQVTEITFFDQDGKMTDHSKYDKVGNTATEDRYDANNNHKQYVTKCGICHFYFDVTKPPGATPEKVYVQ